MCDSNMYYPRYTTEVEPGRDGHPRFVCRACSRRPDEVPAVRVCVSISFLRYKIAHVSFTSSPQKVYGLEEGGLSGKIPVDE